MNTTDSTTASSARLNSVQQLLEKLGSMKATGLGARERLEYMRRHGPELVHDFTFEDAFDADARASSARLEQLDELNSSVRQLETSWRGAPISSEVRAAGEGLIGHISGFVRQAQDLERRAEIDMLAQLWEWAPDVSSTWPELVGKTKSRTARPLRDLYDREADAELEKAKTELEDEVTEENVKETELPAADDLDAELEKAALEKHRQFVRQLALETDNSSDFLEPPPPRFPVEKAFEDVEDSQVVGKVSKSGNSALETEKGRELSRRIKTDPELRAQLATETTRDEESGSSELEDMPRLRHQAWTEAIRESTLEPWRLEMWSSSTRALSMRWMLERDRQAYIKLETTRDREGTHRVRLEWTDPKIRIGRFERELSSQELAELHLDPSSFVTEALESSS